MKTTPTSTRSFAAASRPPSYLRKWRMEKLVPLWPLSLPTKGWSASYMSTFSPAMAGAIPWERDSWIVTSPTVPLPMNAISARVTTPFCGILSLTPLAMSVSGGLFPRHWKVLIPAGFWISLGFRVMASFVTLSCSRPLSCANLWLHTRGRVVFFLSVLKIEILKNSHSFM